MLIRFRCLFAFLLTVIFVIVLISLCARPGISQGPPRPHIASIVIDPPFLKEAGQPFVVTVRARNNGSLAKGSITLSFPDGVEDLQILAHDAAPNNSYIILPGEERQIFYYPTWGKIEPQYPLAEAWYESWPENIEHFIKVKILPLRSAYTIKVYIRMALRGEGRDIYLDPLTSAEYDQQGFPVIVKEVRVLPTPTFTPLPTATFTPLPTATFTPLPTATFAPLPTATFAPLPATTFPPLSTVTPVVGPIVVISPESRVEAIAIIIAAIITATATLIAALRRRG